MNSFTISCVVDDPSKIYLSEGITPDHVVCEGGTLVVQPYSPTLGDLSEEQIGELALIIFSATIGLLLLRWVKAILR